MFGKVTAGASRERGVKMRSALGPPGKLYGLWQPSEKCEVYSVRIQGQTRRLTVTNAPFNPRASHTTELRP